MSSSRFSSSVLSAAKFAVSQMIRNCVAQQVVGPHIRVAPSGTVTAVHRPEERPMCSQEFAISSGQRAVEMEQQNEAKGRECRRSGVKANTGVWMTQLLSGFCSCSTVEVTPLLSF